MRTRVATVAVTFAALLAAAGCTVNPVTGKSQLDLLGEAQEIELGKSLYPSSIQESLGPIEDEGVQQLVAEAPNVGSPAGKERFLNRLGDVVGIEARLDKIDPGGRKARAAERDRALEQCADGFATALKDPTAQAEFTGELLRFMGDRVVQCARGPC